MNKTGVSLRLDGDIEGLKTLNVSLVVCFIASIGPVTEVKTDIYVTSFGPVSDVEMVCTRTEKQSSKHVDLCICCSITVKTLNKNTNSTLLFSLPFFMS